MKKLIILAAVILLMLTAAGCKKEAPQPTQPSEVVTPTDAPYIPAQIDEPEWTPIEGSVQLEGQDTVYADSTQIRYFAIVTKDNQQELRFRLEDAAVQKLSGQAVDGCFITFNGEKIGNASLSDDKKEATVLQDDVSGDITVIASRIRGLAQ